jgi:hypothetical protein
LSAIAQLAFYWELGRSSAYHFRALAVSISGAASVCLEGPKARRRHHRTDSWQEGYLHKALNGSKHYLPWLLALAIGLLLGFNPVETDAAPATAQRATPTPRPASPTPTPVPQPAEPEPAPAPQTVYPVPDDQPADYPIPNGYFFNQAVPAAPRGFGFTISNGAGIAFWSEYQRLGGYAKLGYPTSRRFVHEDTLAQAVQGGILVWQGARGQAELAPLEIVEQLPPEALEPEPPARLASWAAHQPWSGWWWPANAAVAGPHLFDANGPLSKYDTFVSRAGGGDPGTLDWERTELRLSGVSWAGHCNGWAAAAVLEPEPIHGREVAGINFSVADLKGLLAAYHFADAAAWLHGSQEVDVSPLDFHQRLIDWLGNEQKSFIVTFRPAQDEEVWSYPAYRFELVMGPDLANPEVTHVKATVWLADNDVPADFVGLRPWKGEGQTYEYRLIGPREAPFAGEWEGPSASGRFAHPSFIWYPDPTTRNMARALSSPNLSYETIERILGRG